MKKNIPFNKPTATGRELNYISRAVVEDSREKGPSYIYKCNEWMKETFHVKQALFLNSGTAGLEMASLLCDIKASDEIIMPSFTFTSTANAFLLRGAKPVFVDIRPDTLNIDENLIKERITKQSKAICPVHYAGVGCEMDEIVQTALTHGLFVIEDAAHGTLAQFRNRFLGTLGDVGVFSFHETKNFTAGEGGAILINRDKLSKRAELLMEKGTNKLAFRRGEVKEYTWVDIGSSYVPSEVSAAMLYAQLEQAKSIIKQRQDKWAFYFRKLEKLERRGVLKRPFVPEYCNHNAHIFYILLEDRKTRDALQEHLRHSGISAYFHYLPLHASPMGQSLGYKAGQLPVTEHLSACLLRLPIYNTLDSEDQDYVLESIEKFFCSQ